jgi:urease accessory protein
MSGPGAGYVRAVGTATGGTSVTHARARSPLRLFAPRVTPTAAWIVTSTLGGGLVGGDDIRLSVDVEDGARVWLTSQASTKVYRSGRSSSQRLDARIGDGGLLVVWPDPIVAFAGSRFEQRQGFRLGAQATLVVVDCLLSGREAHGERWAFDSYVSRCEIEREGRAIFFDHLRLDAGAGAITERMARVQAYASVVISGPGGRTVAGDILETVRHRPVDPAGDPVVSASPIARDPFGGIALRLAGANPERLTSVVRDLLRPLGDALAFHRFG